MNKFRLIAPMIALTLLTAATMPLRKQKRFYFGSDSIISTKISNPVFTYEVFHKGSYDSVSVNDRSFRSSFRIRELYLIDTVFEAYNHNGQLIHRIRSVKPDGHCRECLQSLLNLFHIYPRLEEFYHDNGMLKERRFKDIQFHDSIRIWYTENGTLRRYQSVYFVADYYPNGVLSFQKLHHSWSWINNPEEGLTTDQRKGFEARYYKSGILQEYLRDTIIDKEHVTHALYYYPTGILNADKLIYEVDGFVLQEITYRADGTLKLKKHYKRPVENNVNGDIPDEMAMGSRDYYDEVPRVKPVPGSLLTDEQWRESLKRSVDSLISLSKLKFSGQYILQYRIDKEGHSHFIQVIGKNSEKLAALLKIVLQSSAKREIPKLSWMPAEQVHRLSFELR